MLAKNNNNDPYRKEWFERRIAALQQTIANKQAARYYGHEVDTNFVASKEHPLVCLYGTELDKVLHQELQATQAITYLLRDQFCNNIHAQATVPLIIDATIQAKNERDIATAFNFANFAHDLFVIVYHGINATTKGALALGRGMTGAIKTVISPAHWKQMVKDTAHLISFVTKEQLEFEILEHAFDDPDQERRSKFYEQYAKDHTKNQAAPFSTFIQNSYATFCKKTWDKKLESCTKFCTTFALELVLMSAATHGASASGRAIINETALIFKQGPKAIAEYGAEAAGIGRLVVEEGETMILDVVEQTLKMIEVNPIILQHGEKVAITEIREIAEFELCLLKSVGKNEWKSPADLIYGCDKKFGTRVHHVFQHSAPNPIKNTHTIFNVPRNKILELVDEAWLLKNQPLLNDTGVYVIDMKKIIGTNNESAIKIIVKPNTSEIITAYPIKI